MQEPIKNSIESPFTVKGFRAMTYFYMRMEYSISLIEKIIIGNGQLVRPSDMIEHLLTDSRNITDGSKSLFFAIIGAQHDGHKYISDAHAKGVRNFVVERFIEYGFTDSNFILVENSIQSLQKLAAYHRQQMQIPVIGITGSNGKTVVKEWLHFLLRNSFNICRSPKSYNSQIGVPLSVAQLNSTHTLGIFEAGISQPDEMQQLEKIIQPGFGIFTNIGSAHNAGFKNQEEKIKEKLKLFTHVETVLYCKDFKAIDNHIQLLPAKKIIWSKHADDSDWKLKNIKIEKGETHFELHSASNQYNITIPFTDTASLENAVHAFIAASVFNADIASLIPLMKILPSVSMRLELKKGLHNSTLINDVYSADIASLEIALHYLNQQSGNGAQQKHVILSDMDGSGVSEDKLYTQVLQLLQQHDIKYFTGIGKDLFKHHQLFQEISNTEFFKSTEEALQNFKAETIANHVVLIKGARRFMLERISNMLTQRTHGTVMKIHMHHLAHNLQVYRSMLQPGVKIMVMVKAFSYGSGTAEIANLLAFNRVDYLAVAYADEGVELRRNGVHLPIMVMNPEPETFAQLLQYKLEPEIYNFRILQLFADYLKNENYIDSHISIHIKLDTGMHRLGFMPEEIPQLAEKILHYKQLHITSVFSHLAAADETQQDAFTLQQISVFKSACDVLEKLLKYAPMRHILNSPGISKFPEAQMDMVRLGIGLYGDDPAKQVSEKLVFTSALETTVTQIKNITTGESIGYGRSVITEKNMRIATLNIGYADGFRRSLGNGVAKVWINNNLYSVVGRVCMDMIMVDITDAKNITEGDIAEIFGEHISLQQFAQWMHTIPYEVLTGISQRVKRIYLQE